MLPFSGAGPGGERGHTIDHVPAVAHQIERPFNGPDGGKRGDNFCPLGRLQAVDRPCQSAARAPALVRDADAPTSASQQRVLGVHAGAVAVHRAAGGSRMPVGLRELRVFRRRILPQRLQRSAERENAGEGNAVRELAAQVRGSAVRAQRLCAGGGPRRAPPVPVLGILVFELAVRAEWRPPGPSASDPLGDDSAG
jgi:hypothetical protein